jgi:hypothetical protein
MPVAVPRVTLSSFQAGHRDTLPGKRSCASTGAMQEPWRWEDPTWARPESDVGLSLLLLEALRRAVDIRDNPASVGLSARPVMLVGVLNAACEAAGVDTTSLWPAMPPPRSF